MALYDPNEFPQEVETTKDFTLADVLAWARTRPADEGYDYGDLNNCAIGQFLRETGRAAEPVVGGTAWYDEQEEGRPDRPLPADVICPLYRGDKTFGALADRLEKALA